MSLKRALIKFVLGGARRLGYDITPYWRLPQQPLVRHTRALFDKYSIDAVFDVGANLGQYHDLLRDEVGFNGLIVSFEPVREYADRLQARSAHEPNWIVKDFALGSVEESVPINVTSSPGLNSFLTPIQRDLVRHTEVVSIRRLESIFHELQRAYGFGAPYLKIDTQGFDLSVVKGAGIALGEFRALQTEASIRAGYEGMPTYLQTLDSLSEVGFEVSGMFPVWHDKALRLVEFDLVMTNRAFADPLSVASE